MDRSLLLCAWSPPVARALRCPELCLRSGYQKSQVLYKVMFAKFAFSVFSSEMKILQAKLRKLIPREWERGKEMNNKGSCG